MARPSAYTPYPFTTIPTRERNKHSIDPRQLFLHCRVHHPLRSIAERYHFDDIMHPTVGVLPCSFRSAQHTPRNHRSALIGGIFDSVLGHGPGRWLRAAGRGPPRLFSSLSAPLFGRHSSSHQHEVALLFSPMIPCLRFCAHFRAACLPRGSGPHPPCVRRLCERTAVRGRRGTHPGRGRMVVYFYGGTRGTAGDPGSPFRPKPGKGRERPHGVCSRGEQETGKGTSGGGRPPSELGSVWAVSFSKPKGTKTKKRTETTPLDDTTLRGTYKKIAKHPQHRGMLLNSKRKSPCHGVIW